MDIECVDESELKKMISDLPFDENKFTRRKAIWMAEKFGLEPMVMVKKLEDRGVIKKGSHQWFEWNGGITQKHVEQAKQGRLI